MNALQREALAWYDRGITPIPLVYRTKRPVVGWRQWVDQQPPAAILQRWFCGLRNMAIIISGDLVVLDFDIPAFYHRWRMAQPTLSQTYTVKSNRGYHAYLYAKTPTKTASMEGGEILASGHMLTVPPSTHESGHIYRVLGSGEILTVSGLDEAGIIAIEREKSIFLDNEQSYDAPVILPTSGNHDDWDEKPVTYIKRRIDMYDLLVRLGFSGLGSGKTVVMRCPFHEDKNPSFQVWRDGAYCHSTNCKAHRQLDVISMAAMWWQVSQSTAISMLARMI